MTSDCLATYATNVCNLLMLPPHNERNCADCLGCGDQVVVIVVAPVGQVLVINSEMKYLSANQ